MNPLLKSCSLLLLLCSNLALAQIPVTSSQLIVVTTPDWDATQGNAQRYERKGQDFQKVGDAFPIVVGKTGLAWGRGIMPIDLGELILPSTSGHPVKR
ncbi:MULTISPECIES: hypothetical protein [unclassified Pseudomonas]|uniref:hypothetical protein n=1 Tax=unclassified Pseudomonas TaxID=196821 RepID=UPI00385CA87E